MHACYVVYHVSTAFNRAALDVSQIPIVYWLFFTTCFLDPGLISRLASLCSRRGRRPVGHVEGPLMFPFPLLYIALMRLMLRMHVPPHPDFTQDLSHNYQTCQ